MHAHHPVSCISKISMSGNQQVPEMQKHYSIFAAINRSAAKESLPPDCARGELNKELGRR